MEVEQQLDSAALRRAAMSAKQRAEGLAEKVARGLDRRQAESIQVNKDLQSAHESLQQLCKDVEKAKEDVLDSNGPSDRALKLGEEVDALNSAAKVLKAIADIEERLAELDEHLSTNDAVLACSTVKEVEEAVGAVAMSGSFGSGAAAEILRALRSKVALSRAAASQRVFQDFRAAAVYEKQTDSGQVQIQSGAADTLWRCAGSLDCELAAIDLVLSSLWAPAVDDVLLAGKNLEASHEADCWGWKSIAGTESVGGLAHCLVSLCEFFHTQVADESAPEHLGSKAWSLLAHKLGRAGFSRTDLPSLAKLTEPVLVDMGFIRAEDCVLSQKAETDFADIKLTATNAVLARARAYLLDTPNQIRKVGQEDLHLIGDILPTHGFAGGIAENPPTAVSEAAFRLGQDLIDSPECQHHLVHLYLLLRVWGVELDQLAAALVVNDAVFLSYKLALGQDSCSLDLITVLRETAEQQFGSTLRRVEASAAHTLEAHKQAWKEGLDSDAAYREAETSVFEALSQIRKSSEIWEKILPLPTARACVAKVLNSVLLLLCDLADSAATATTAPEGLLSSVLDTLPSLALDAMKRSPEKFPGYLRVLECTNNAR